jgi:capsid protein
MAKKTASRAKKPRRENSLPVRGSVVLIRARYDAAQTTDNNERHWLGADSLSADAANSLYVRQKLRNRARYEVANNAWARGIVSTFANDLVGSGPRLQLRTDNPALNAEVEREFALWSRRSRLAPKLRTLVMSRVVDGEGFAGLIDNPTLRHAVRLDLGLIECDRVTAPTRRIGDPGEIDGVVLDEAGNVRLYRVMQNHPGDLKYLTLNKFDDWQPADMIHWFRADRAGQHRGIPDLTPSLETFAQLRRYRLAVLDAAETAANVSGVLETDMPPKDSEGDATADELPPQAIFDMERNTFLTTPMGWRLKQVEAAQPSPEHVAYVESIVGEIARPISMPLNIALCNSSKYNFASGRLDHQTYWRSLDVDRDDLEAVALDVILGRWLEEAALALPFGPELKAILAAAGLLGEVPHEWYWPGREHVDPSKDATAQQTRLDALMATYAAEYAKDGKDWEQEFEQRGKEEALKKKLGLSTDAAAPRAKGPANDGAGDDESDGEGDDQDDSRRD